MASDYKKVDETTFKSVEPLERTFTLDSLQRQIKRLEADLVRTTEKLAKVNALISEGTKLGVTEKKKG